MCLSTLKKIITILYKGSERLVQQRSLKPGKKNGRRLAGTMPPDEAAISQLDDVDA